MPLASGAKFAGYTIERQLGAGGMGEVYLAQHPRLPKHDAIKVLKSEISSDPDYIERFNREADLASKLWHPHIVGILDRGKYRSTACHLTREHPAMGARRWVLPDSRRVVLQHLLSPLVTLLRRLVSQPR